MACVVLSKNSGKIAPIPTTAREATSEINMMPIVRGNWIKRWLMYPKIAASTMISEIILYISINIF
jgi:hypothetical protein